MTRSSNQPVQVDIVAPAIVSSGPRDKTCVVVSSQDVVVITTDDAVSREEHDATRKSIRLSPRFLFTATVALMSCLFFVASSLLILSFPILGYGGQVNNVQLQNVSSVRTHPMMGSRVIHLTNENGANQKFVHFRNNEAPVQHHHKVATFSQEPRRVDSDTNQSNLVSRPD